MARKKSKATQKPRLEKAIPRGAKAKITQDNAPSPLRPSPQNQFWVYFYFLFLLITGTYFFRQQSVREGVSFTVAAVLIFCFSVLFNDESNGAGKMRERVSWFLILSFWVLGCISLLSFPNFSYVFGKTSMPLDRATWLWFLSLIVVSFALRYLPTKKNQADLNPFLAGTLLSAVLIAAFCIRMYRSETPGGCYWDDWSVEVVDPLNMATFHDFYFLFPIGKREPFFSYFMSLIWWILPDATMIFVQRLTCTLIDAGTVLFLYFLGKELKSRRTGLIAAALGAISIPLIVKCINGMRLISLPLAVAFLLWTLFRVVRRPSPGRFILWGLAMGFGTYTYTGFRIWVFYSIFGLFAWLAVTPRQKSLPAPVKAAVFLAGLLSMLFFLQANGYLAGDNLLGKLILSRAFELPLSGLALLTLLTAALFSKSGQEKAWSGWGWGTWIGLATAYPILIQKEITDRMKVLTIFQDPNYSRWALSTPVHLLGKWMVAFRTAFFTWEGDVERSDLGIRWDAFFDFHTLIFFFLALALFISKPTKRMAFLMGGVLVGMTPYVFSFDPHSGKLVGCIVPVLAAGAWGMDSCLDSAEESFPRFKPLMAALLLAFFFAFGGKVNFQECYPKLFKPQFPNVLVSHQATEDAQKYMVFLHPYESRFGAATALTQTVLEEKNHVRLVQSSNAIYLKPGEEERNIAVQTPYTDPAMFERIRREFPETVWTDLRADWQPDNAALIHRGIIPIRDLSEKPGKLFYIQRISPSTWTRDFYDVRAGIARGVIATEDTLPLTAAIPVGLGGEVSGRFTGSFHADADGNYKFSVSSGNYVILKIDGKKRLDMRPRPVGIVLARSVTTRLLKGDHQIEYLISYQNGRNAPPVQVLPPVGPEQTLGDSPEIFSSEKSRP